MLARLFNWIAWLKARDQLAYPLVFSPNCWLSPQKAPRADGEVLPRAAPAFAHLAAHYDRYSGQFPRDYVPFLATTARRLARPVRSVLDLGCGTGAFARAAARRFERVVGVDASPEMLTVARDLSGDLPNVALVQGDFRSFELRERFDAAVCTSDTLNYSSDASELSAVLSCVARHLAPGGLFLFDILTQEGFEAHNGLCLHYKFDGERFAMSFHFDPQTRRERTLVILPEALEVHHRIPLCHADVEAACGESFSIADYFTGRLGREFFALVRAGSV